MATDQFDAGVRATNALSALNEFYSHEFARAVEAYKGLEQVHQVLCRQLAEARREALAGSVLAATVERVSKGGVPMTLTSTLKEKHPAECDATPVSSLEKALDEYERARAVAVKADG